MSLNVLLLLSSLLLKSTFKMQQLVCAAEGRTVRGCEEFDFCFGGRRQFCKSNYADLGETDIILTLFILLILGCLCYC